MALAFLVDFVEVPRKSLGGLTLASRNTADALIEVCCTYDALISFRSCPHSSSQCFVTCRFLAMHIRDKLFPTAIEQCNK